MIRILLVLAILAGLLYLMREFRKLPAAQRKPFLLKYGVWVAVGIVVLLAATGRLHWIGALIAGAIPFAMRLANLGIRVLPFWEKFRAATGASVLKSAFIELRIDQASGAVSGTVVSGPFRGQSLDTLSDADLKLLEEDIAGKDQPSKELLNAYLNYRFNRSQQSANQRATTGMSRTEALQVLGLEDSATEKEINHRHKLLMQRVHPDRGGSDYLAARINEAKDVLLG